ncbi:MAG TPA: TIGR00266 family protein [Thermoanaerobaculia bacterium]|nr:TIGR00266 family protein [Thermoanaerobaculia bacterium]
MSRDEIVAGLQAGRIGRDAHVFSQGMPNWVPITSQPEFAEAFGPSGAVPPPPPPGMGGGQRAHEIDYELFGEDMQYVEVTLDPGEACIAEAGAFMYMDPGIQMQTIFGDGSGQDQGGFMGKLLSAGKRMLTGESLFMTAFGNGASGRQKVAFAAPYPGKIIALDLKQHNGRILCEKDSFLCAARGISVGIAFQRKLGTGFFGGEGFILQKLEGDGYAFIHSGGTIVARDLAPGETLRVDTGCLVAFESQVSYDIQFVGGIKTAVFGGEGLFYAALTGPGKIWLQSLPFSRFAGKVMAHLPSGVAGRRGEGSVLGGIGEVLMGD